MAGTSTPPSDMTESNSARSSFQSIKVPELPKVELDHQFSDVQLLAENSGAKVYSARRLEPKRRCLVLKCLQKETTNQEEFISEFGYNYYFGQHPHFIACFDDIFETDSAYVFTQEFVPMGDLAKFVKNEGIGELKSKCVAKQVTAALELMHQKKLAHRDVCLENIFVFDHEEPHFKLGDFGNTQRVGALVKKSKVRSPWAPPEVSLAVYNEGYYVQSVQDAWQLGILIFVCLTGSYPWSSADITDRHYNSWVAWLKRKTTKTPPRFRCFTPRLLRLLRRLLEPKPENRCDVKEVHKYLSDSWLMKESNGSDAASENSSSENLQVQNASVFKNLEKKVGALLRSRMSHSNSCIKDNLKIVAVCP